MVLAEGIGADAADAAAGAPAAPVRPALTFPPEIAALVGRTYAGADAILEFGAGGSTVLAAEMAGKAVWSVESDAAFAAALGAWFAANPPASPVVIHHVDLGPTGAWGRPRDARRAAAWPLYATSVWDLPGFRHPDVILVDGRFRLACALVAALKVERPTRLLFDDYATRPQYHAFERLVPRAATCGRMVVFDLVPLTLPRDLVGLLAQSLTTPD